MVPSLSATSDTAAMVTEVVVEQGAPQVAVRLVPQPLEAVTVPQVLAAAAQSCASVSGVQPQTLALPPPPQVSVLFEQEPQVMVRVVPQPLGTLVSAPQLAPRAAHSCA